MFHKLIITAVVDDKVVNTTMYVKGGLLQIVNWFHHEVIGTWDGVISMKSITDTAIVEYIPKAASLAGGSYEIFKCKMAYIMDHPTKENKSKTVFEYLLVEAPDTAGATRAALDHVSNSRVANEYRVDSVSLISAYDVVELADGGGYTSLQVNA